MSVPGYRNEPTPAWDPAGPVDFTEAEAFIRLYYREHPQKTSVEDRLARIQAEIEHAGTYTHTHGELVFGARVAWRNASRCIGRLYWRSLVVRDLRMVSEPDEVFDELVNHLQLAGQRERSLVRPVISIFAPHQPGRPFTRLWNEQLIRYAGHRDADGNVVGDPMYVDFTETMRQHGWRGKPDEPFDVLPVAIESASGRVRIYDLPESAVWEIPFSHPEHRWFAELGLRWHAIPAISNLRLSIGGVSYPLAPFNGWYMSTEIGARNLADADRYNQLPAVAERLGLDMSSDRTLWRDRALVELNRAVLWSFDRAGARISDHHGESHRFLAHVASEERNGRATPADWSWIVPPMSGATTGVFHRYYHEADLRPNFYLDAEARDLAKRGRPPVRPPDDAFEGHDEPPNCVRPPVHRRLLARLFG
jgi:nitric-oxide synthase